MVQPLKILVLISLILTLSACAGDKDFSGVEGTVDIELSNVEEIASGLLQSTVLAHKYSPLDRYLGLSDLPFDISNLEAIPCEGGSSDEHKLIIDGYAITSPEPGTVSVVVTRNRPSANEISSDNSVFVKGVLVDSDELDPPAEDVLVIAGDLDPEQLSRGVPHKEGDKVTVLYNSCVDEDGLIHNGMVELNYDEINGINDRFLEIDTQTCVDNLVDEFSLIVSPIVVSGESVVPRLVGDTLRLEVDGEESLIVIGKDDRRVVVLDRPGAGTTSLDGDLVYTVIERDWQRQRCQRYERQLSTKVSNLATTWRDITTIIDGEIDLINVSIDLDRVETAIDEEGTFSVVTRRNNFEGEYFFENLGIQNTRVLSTRTFTSRILNGRVYSDLFGGRLLYNFTLVNDTGTYEFPDDGHIEVAGQGAESMRMDIGQFNDLVVRVDYNGDADLDGRPEVDETFSATWSRLLSRDFDFSE